MGRRALVACCVVAAGFTAPAKAQRLGLRVTSEGFDALGALAEELAPRELRTPELDTTVSECPATDRVISAHVPPTDINLSLTDVQLRTTDGGLIASARLSVSGATDVFIDNPFGCLGEADCDVVASVDDVPVQLTFGLMTSADGGVELTAAGVSLPLTSADVDLQSEGCAAGEVATWLFSAFENWMLERGVPQVEALLEERMAGIVSDLLRTAFDLEVELGPLTISGSLASVETDAAGLTATGDASLLWTGDTVFDAEPAPTPSAGDDPFAGAPRGMFQLAVADQAVNDALFEAWRGGLIQRLLRTPIATPRIPLDGIGIVQQLGLPEGTNLAIQADLGAPLEVRFGRAGDDVAEVRIRDLHVTVAVRAPATAASTIDAFVSGEAAAQLRLDGEGGGLVLGLRDLIVDSLELRGREGDGFAFDRSRFEAFLRRTVIPLVSERIGELPIAPSLQELFGRFVALRTLSSSDGWQRLGIDLHARDEGDRTPPATFLAEARALMPAGTTSLEVSGEDNSTPPGLLRFRAVLDGDSLGEPSGFRTVSFDASEGSHELEVYAVDLAGNEDPSPATFRFDVDGTPPELRVVQAPAPVLDGSTVEATWEASDERPGVESRWLLRRVPDGMPRETIREGTWFPGGGTMRVDGLPSGEIFELVIEARDSAGNLSSESFGLTASPAGGCAVDGAPAPVLSALFALLLFRRRR